MICPRIYSIWRHKQECIKGDCAIYDKERKQCSELSIAKAIQALNKPPAPVRGLQ